MDASADFDSVFKGMLNSNICANDSSLYVYSACFFEAKGRLCDAETIYKLGISKNAEPIKWLEKAHALFLSRITKICNAASSRKVDHIESATLENNGINPWDTSTMNDLLKKINPLMRKYEGYCSSTKPYTGKVALSTLKNASKNKVIEIGGMKYCIKGCAGHGGFAQIYKANVKSHLSLGNFTCTVSLIIAFLAEKGQAMVLLIEFISSLTVAYSSVTI